MKETNFKNLQKNVYRRSAGCFDEQQRRENRNHLNKIIAISRFLNIQENERVLEIGIGTGIHADHLLRLNAPSFFFTGIDYSRDMLLQAQRRLAGGKDVDLVAMDGEKLAFPDETFDKIYISGSLHHFCSPAAGIREMVRVLRPGGRFCVMEPNRFFPTNLYAILTKPEERNMRLMSKQALQTWLALPGIDSTVDNYAYTPPFPKMLLPLFDCLDDCLYRCPFLNRLSIMLFARGTKWRQI